MTPFQDPERRSLRGDRSIFGRLSTRARQSGRARWLVLGLAALVAGGGVTFLVRETRGTSHWPVPPGTVRLGPVVAIPPPPGGTACTGGNANFLVTGSEPFNPEDNPDIAFDLWVSPGRDADDILVACYERRNSNGDLRVGVARSTDQGVTWETVNDPFDPSISPDADSTMLPSIAFSFPASGDPLDPGWFYVAYLEAKEGSAGATTDTAIGIRRSTDSGATWGSGIEVELESDDMVFLDRPKVAVDPFGSTSPSRVYVSYSRVDLGITMLDTCFSDPAESYDIFLEGSTDGGMNFDMGTGPVRMSDPDAMSSHGASLAVSLNAVYVAYAEIGCGVSEEIWAATVGADLTGSVTRKKVSDFVPFPLAYEYCGLTPALFSPLTAQALPASKGGSSDPCDWSLVQVNNFPSIDVAIEGGDDHVMVAWASCVGTGTCGLDQSAHAEIFFSKTDDFTMGFQAPFPVVVNHDAPAEVHQFFPVVTTVKDATGGPDGIVRVAYLDRRNDPSNQAISVWQSHSTDLGATWDPNDFEVRCTSSAPGFGADSYIGEYIGGQLDDDIDSTSTVNYSWFVWPERRSTVPDLTQVEEEIWMGESDTP